jgi:hypothetical protein
MEETMSDTDPSLVALKSCGCVVAAMVDTPEFRRDNAKEVARLMRNGFAIQRLSVASARNPPWARSGGVCEHDSVQESIV